MITLLIKCDHTVPHHIRETQENGFLLRVLTYICRPLYKDVDIFIYIYVYTYLDSMHIYIHTYTYIYIYMHQYYTYMYIYTHIYIYFFFFWGGLRLLFLYAYVSIYLLSAKQAAKIVGTLFRKILFLRLRVEFPFAFVWYLFNERTNQK